VIEDHSQLRAAVPPRPIAWLALGCALLVACGGGEDDPDDDAAGDECVGQDCDADQDGYTLADGDCDDDEPLVHPGNHDPWGDGVDQNCDGIDGVDGDLDGYPGNALADDPSLDCDDDDPAVHPGADEICGNGVDDDCDGHLGDCGFVDEFPLSEAELTLLGESAGSLAGWDVDAAADLTGNGERDLIIGAPGYDERGRVYVVGADATGDLDLSAADVIIEAEATADRAGWDVGLCQDVTGDGIDDLVLGAPGYGCGPETDCGAAYVLAGPLTSSHIGLEDGYTVRASSSEGSVLTGASVACVGDVDGDGAGDLLVGAPESMECGIGEAYLLRGPLLGDYSLPEAADTTLHSGMGWGQFAATVAAFGDMTGNGLAEFFVSINSPLDGTVLLLPGTEMGVTHVSDYGAYAELRAGGGLLGHDIDVGYMDEDDRLDVALVGWEDGEFGATYLRLGRVDDDIEMDEDTDAQIFSDVALPEGEEFFHDRSVAFVGDVNADGMGDLITGDPFDPEGTYAGSAFLFLGPVDDEYAQTDGIRFIGTAPWSLTGGSVTGAGDVNGDGIPDFAIGAPGHDGAGTDAGEVYLVMGRASQR